MYQLDDKQKANLLNKHWCECSSLGRQKITHVQLEQTAFTKQSQDRQRVRLALFWLHSLFWRASCGVLCNSVKHEGSSRLIWTFYYRKIKRYREVHETLAMSKHTMYSKPSNIAGSNNVGFYRSWATYFVITGFNFGQSWFLNRDESLLYDYLSLQAFSCSSRTVNCSNQTSTRKQSEV